MGLIRKLAGLALGFMSFIAGCWWNGGVGEIMYGMVPAYGIPIPPHDSTVTLDDFSYTPPSPASPGDTLEFTATTNKPTSGAWITARIGDPPEYNIWLNDDGIAPDSIAGDGIWHGEQQLPLDAALAQNIPVTAQLLWQDGFQGQELAGEDLTILEDGE